MSNQTVSVSFPQIVICQGIICTSMVVVATLDYISHVLVM